MWLEFDLHKRTTAGTAGAKTDFRTALPGDPMNRPRVHFWDMDHTLINNDCDVSWKEFLIAGGWAPPGDRAQIEFFFNQYLAGRLDHDAFMAFQLREFAGQTPAAMRALALRHYRDVVRARIYPDGLRLVQEQQRAGDCVALLTATNRLLAEPLAQRYGFDLLVATELEQDAAGRFTGRLAGIYCGREGKVPHLEAACRRLGVDPAAVSYYGDSSSDLHVLRRVGHPVVVNAMPALRAEAERCGWPALRFRLPDNN